jgi:hypothetical protein
VKIVFYIEHPDPDKNRDGVRFHLICTYSDYTNIEVLMAQIQREGVFEVENGKKVAWHPAHRVISAEIWYGSEDPNELLKEVEDGHQ